MKDGIRYGEVTFDASFLFARHEADGDLKFTRSERALLLLFTRHPRTVLTRNQLLDAIAGTGSDSTDRSIDFLINRLRAKLGDSARQPVLIATQYGEGYVWIADPVRGQAPVDAFLVIGPVYGLDPLRPSPTARRFLDQLRRELDLRTAAGERVVCVERWNRDEASGSRARFSIDVSFYRGADVTHGAVVLRDGASRHILCTHRFAIDGDQAAAEAASRLAGELQAALWQALTLGSIQHAAPADAPLEVRMQDASLLLTRSHENWTEMEAQLRTARAASPDDPQVGLMWGMYLYARLILGAAKEDLTETARAELEQAIEAEALACLPRIGGNPLLVMGAAKLLYFAGRGHEALAERLAEQAFAASTAFAAAFAILGQIRMGKGEIAAAVELYDHGLELCEPGTEFEVYFLVLKASAHLAVADRVALEATCNRLYQSKPVTRMQLGLFVAAPEPDALPTDLRMLLEQFDLARAQRAVTYLYYVSARLFRRQEHRDNIMRGLISHTVRRFGPSVVTDEVRRAVPALVPSAT